MSIILKELTKNGIEVIPNGSMEKISPKYEFYKWLSYEPDFEIEHKKLLYSKSISSLSSDDLMWLQKYQERDYYKRLFKKYIELNCNCDELYEAYEYMKNNSIKNIMYEKLTKHDLRCANNTLEIIKQLDDKTIRNIIKTSIKKDMYLNISIVSAYILHMLCDYYYALSESKSINIINAMKSENIKRYEKVYLHVK